MAEPQHQALSDLLDGVLDEASAEAAIDALLQDPALAAEWHRMHQLRGLLRAEADAPFDVASAVRDAIASEPAFLLPTLDRPAQPRRWPRYAVGGARINVDTTGALGPIPSLATQVNNYLTSTGGRADANALYTVWGGANDLFAITNAGADLTYTASPAATAAQRCQLIRSSACRSVGPCSTNRNG